MFGFMIKNLEIKLVCYGNSLKIYFKDNFIAETNKNNFQKIKDVLEIFKFENYKNGWRYILLQEKVIKKHITIKKSRFLPALFLKIKIYRYSLISIIY